MADDARPVGDQRPRVVAGTIVSRSYLPAARVLAESYLRQHPESAVRVLVLDAAGDELAELAGARSPFGAKLGDVALVGPDRLDLEPDEFYRMAAAYTVTELATALKPWLLRLLLDESDIAMYLDPDIEVFAPFPEVGELAVAHGIVLTPHVTEPMPRDGRRPSEADIMASGVFNLGFVAVSSAAVPFLDFWAQRLRHDALVAPAEQMFTDQRWVDNVPALYHHTVLRDPGFNVAYWNVYHRPVRRGADGTLTVGGQPLRFFHFSGFRPEKPWLLSTHFTDRPRVLLSDEPDLARLCTDYRAKLLAAGYGKTLDSVPYRWATLPDGTPLPAAMRRAFRDAWVDAERTGKSSPPSPFVPGGAAEFLAWAAAAADEAQRVAGSTRWAMAVWQARTDLRQAFPEPLGADAAAFRQWCATSGLAEGELHPAAVPRPVPSVDVPVADEPGVNLLGYLTAELGVGEMGRLVLDAIRAAELPVAAVVEETTVVNRTGHPMPTGEAVEPRFPVSLLCVNADMTEPTVRLHPGLVDGRHVIGLWSWELSVFPEWMRAAFASVDEVWTISEFCRAAIAEHASVPVRVFPVPVRDPYAGCAHPERTAPQRTASGPTSFLFVFDHNSIFDRKNPLAVVQAFHTAFGDRDDVRLVIKSINGDKHLGDRERLRLAVAGDLRIELIEQYLSSAKVSDLFAAADCYVSLHRSEGFGLTVAEAMARGLPVIATDYSGTEELLTAETGWPVGYREVPVGPGCYPYPPDAHWAEPDVRAAAAAMRAVAADPAAARARGAAARRHVLRTRSQVAAARWVTDALAEARQRWQARTGKNVAALATAPSQALGPLPIDREALRWRADANAPSRFPFAPAVRKAVLRALDHYDYHQRSVLGSVLDAVENSIARLDARSDGRLAALSTRHDATERELAETVAGLRADGMQQFATVAEAIRAETGQRDQQVAALGARLDAIEARLAAVTAERDELDAKLMAVARERDVRIDDVAALAKKGIAASEEAAKRLRVLDTALVRHHELLDPASDGIDSVVVPTDVGVLRLPADDTVMLPWLRYYGCWEPDESALVDHLLTSGDTFVDIGAHVGYFTVRALRRVGPRGAVFAVEPWAPVRQLLDHNVRANVPAACDALTVLPFAAWDQREDLVLRAVEPGNSGDHRVGVAVGGDPVGGIRLDEVPTLRERRIRLVKCDAQGQDHRALNGLGELLRAHRPDVLCEFWPAAIREVGADPADVVTMFVGWGYQALPLTESVLADALAGRPLDDRRWSVAELVRLAEESASGFVTLWLRPPAAAGHHEVVRPSATGG